MAEVAQQARPDAGVPTSLSSYNQWSMLMSPEVAAVSSASLAADASGKIVNNTKYKFMLRSEVLRLYRNMLRLTYKVGDLDQRKHLQQWIRGDFENNRHHKEEEVIRMMISKGKLSLRELEQTVMMVQ